MRLLVFALISIVSLVFAIPLHDQQLKPLTKEHEKRTQNYVSPNVVLLAREETKEQATERLLYHTSLEDFVMKAKNKDPPNLIWETDGCDMVGETPMGVDFANVCWRHVGHGIGPLIVLLHADKRLGLWLA